MPAHNTLTGADLHESKGVASASANTVAVADGAGSTNWTKVTASSIDTTTILNLNKMTLTYQIPTAASASDIYIAVPRAGNLVKVSATLNIGITVTDLTLTIRNGATISGTLVIPQAGSTAGTTGNTTALSTNSFAADSVVRVSTNATTGAAVVIVILDFTNT